jgi:hypothetical protein
MGKSSVKLLKMCIFIWVFDWVGRQKPAILGQESRKTIPAWDSWA